MFARTVARVAQAGVRRFGDGPHPTFNNKKYPHALIAGTTAFVMLGGVGVVKFSLNYQCKKHGFTKDKYPIGYTP